MTYGVVNFKDLTNEELIVLAKGEDNEEAKEFFFKRNKPFVYSEARKFLNTGMELDDLFSIGMIGFLKAYNHYNIEKGYKFTTLASRIIINEILMELRKNRKHKEAGLMSLNDAISTDENSNNLYLEDVVSDIRINVEEEAVSTGNSQILDHVLNVLSERDKDIVLMHMKGVTQDDISEQYGLSQSFISRIIKRSIEKMQKAYQKSLA